MTDHSLIPPPLPPNIPTYLSPTSSPSAASQSPPTAETSPHSSPLSLLMDAAHFSHSSVHPADASNEDDFFVLDSSPYSTHRTHTNSTDLPSDVPALRRIHITNGYREGLTAAKETSLQVGFDLGFPDGAAAGARAGWVLGVLIGLERGNEELIGKVLRAAREGLGIKEVVEVMEERGGVVTGENVKKGEEGKRDDEGEEGKKDDEEEKLVMEDVRFKEGLLESWYQGTRKVLGGAVVG